MATSLEDTGESTWIVSGQSPFQQRLVDHLPLSTTLRLQGPFTVWLRDRRVQYIQLIGPPVRGDSNANHHRITAGGVIHSEFVEDHPVDESTAAWREWAETQRLKRPRRPANAHCPTRHEQAHESIIALGATGTSSKTSAAAWLAHLQANNPRLLRMPVLIEMAHTIDNQVVAQREK